MHFRNADGELDFESAALAVDGPIRLRETIFGDDFAFLASTVDPGVTAKLTIPSPSMVHYRGGRAAIDPAVYPDEEQFWADLSAPPTPSRCGGRRARLPVPAARRHQPRLPERPGAARPARPQRGDDAEHQHLRYIRQINAAITDRPAGLAVTTHMCRGNFRSSWAAEGGYDFVAEALFSELAVDGFFLEYDDERSGGFAPLRFVPPGKMVVLGLVTTKRGALESKDDAEAAHRRGEPVRAAGAAVPVAAVRLLLDGRGQRAVATTRRSPSCG